MSFDAGVHHGLGVAGFVTLVMPEAAKSNHVEHDVQIKFAAIIKCDLHDAIRGFGVVTVDMKDRRLRNMSRVSRVDRAAAEARRCRKTDLIINDDMDRAAGSVARQARKLERFHHDALAGKRRVAV